MVLQWFDLVACGFLLLNGLTWCACLGFGCVAGCCGVCLQVLNLVCVLVLVLVLVIMWVVMFVLCIVYCYFGFGLCGSAYLWF